MIREILFITEYKSGTERNIQRYTESEMVELFTPEQRNALAAGQTIEYRAQTDCVDLLAFYDANK